MKPDSDDSRGYFEPEIGSGGRRLITFCWVVFAFVVLSYSIDQFIRVVK